MELNTINKKKVLIGILILIIGALLCGCSSSTSSNGIALSYDDFLAKVSDNNYVVNEYQLTLDNYGVDEIQVTKGSKFTASYEVFTNTEAVDHIYKNSKKYYKSSYDLVESTDNKMVFEADEVRVTIIKSNLSILTMEDSTSNYQQTTNLLDLCNSD